MLKSISTSLLVVFSLVSASAQLFDPVDWSWTAVQVDGDTYELVYTATMQNGWNVYSQYTSDDGPVPTAIEYESAEGIELIGKSIEEGKKKSGYDKLFDVEVIKFLSDKPFVIRQKIKVLDRSKPISGYLTFMTCDEEKCLPPKDIDFSFTIPASRGLTASPNTTASATEQQIATPAASTKVPPPTAVGSSNEATSSIGSITLPKDQAADQIATVEGIETPAQDNSKIITPLQWTIEVKKTGPNTFDLIYRADLLDGWATYGKDSNLDGPIPTLITYEEASGIELVGELIESGNRKEGPEPVFDNVNVIKYLSDQPFVSVQKVRVTDPSKIVKGYIESMACDKKGCIKNPDENFAFDLSGAGAVVDYDSGDTGLSVDLPAGTVDVARPALISTYNAPLSDCGADESQEKDGLIWLLIAGLIGGFAALLTPCVFPMIPITVSFFTKDTKRKGWVNGLIYGASIIIIYVVLGFLITVFLGPEALNKLSTSWIANTLFFVIFIVFAFSFFGFYEITLPSSWSTKSDSMADKGGLIGIFFMAATLALVSFSCTGPIVGSALVAAANGGFMGPLVVMFGFSAALALPFGLFAAFPAWLNSLPKSGGWMNSVKVVLGFLEIGFAFKFLSTADLTQHWGILKYETFMLILILVALAISLYLFGFIKFPHDSPIKKLGIPRRAIATAFGILGVYLMTGFTINDNTGIYNSLWLTSGFSPPVNYNIFLDKQQVDPALKEKYGSAIKGANNITMFKDYAEGLAYARETNRPAFIDFTGHGCQNCRRTEDNIWVQDQVRNFLNDSIVLISLYVDDREKLSQTYISSTDGEKKRTVGSKWADFQVTNFRQNSQPLYIMITPDEEVITHPRPYKEGTDDYLSYLECGMKYYRQM